MNESLAGAQVCAPDSPSLRRELAARIEDLLAGPPVFYLWGGATSLELGVDCSGLVIVLARDLSTPLPRPRPTTDDLWNHLEAVTEPEPGDLALYGRGLVGDPANHVMVCLGAGEKPGTYRVAGMSGGGSKTTSLELARKFDCRLKGYGSHLYRQDFIGWRRLPFDKAPGVVPASEV